MLPRLNLKDLISVSCTCKALRDAAYLRDEPWRRAASEFLPPAHPSCAGLSRTAVQQVLQQRVAARRNVIAGRTGASLEIFTGPRTVSKLQWSVCGNFVAVLTDETYLDDASRLSLYSAPDGAQLWQQELNFIKESCGLLALRYWERMQWHIGSGDMLIAVLSNDEPTTDVSVDFVKLSLCKLVTDTGALSSTSSAQLCYSDGFNNGNAMWGHNLAFSHQGRMMAVVHNWESVEGQTHSFELRGVVLDVEACTVLLTVQRPVPDPHDVFAPVWAHNDSMVVAACRLVHVDTGVVHVLNDPRDLNAHESDGRAFDRTGAYLGYTHAGHWTMNSPRMASVFDTASGSDLFQDNGCRFVSFFSCSRRVLLMRDKTIHRGGYLPMGMEHTAEIWSFATRSCLQAVKLSGALHMMELPQLHFDSVLFWQGPRPGAGLSLQLWRLGASTAKLQLRRVAVWCMSPDGCTLATAVHGQDDDVVQETLSLRKLC